MHQYFEEILDKAMSIVMLIVGWTGQKFCKYYYQGQNQALLPIKCPLLLESATDAAEMIRTKKCTSLELVTACIERIQEINHITNCVAFTRFDKAIKEAEAADELIRKGTVTKEDLERDKPFFGVPFTVKDGIAIKGMIQTSGIVARINHIAEKDADLVTLLKEAGGIPIATTLVPEWMVWWDCNNEIFGRPKNPYHSQYCVGGSSGGEGAVLAAAGSMMGIGSDRGGSIRTPAYMCGIFGHKPTLGTISLLGHFPEAHEEDLKLATTGPMAKKAKDLIPMLKVLTKNNPDLKLDEPVDIKDLHFYCMEHDGGGPFINGVDVLDPEMKEMMDEVISYLKTTHGITVNRVNLPEMKWAPQMYIAAQKTPPSVVYEGKMSPTTALWEMFKAMFGLSDHPLEYTWPVFFEGMAPEYGSNLQKFYMTQQENLVMKFHALLGSNGVFLFPTQPTPPVHHNESLFRPHNRGYHSIFNNTRMPTTHCPIKLSKKGLPIGLQVAALPNQDRLCFAVAQELEKGFGGWVPPPAVDNTQHPTPPHH